MTAFLDPSAAELLAALDAAAEQSGFSGRPDWRPLHGRIANDAEGRVRLDDRDPLGWQPHFVSVVWWSDYQGRRHVRVVGGEPDHASRDFHATLSQYDDRPPLWHVGSDRVFRVQRGDAEPVWLASCVCGATGTPASVGWMAGRCGPCHDRCEEGLPPVAGPVPWLRLGRPVHSLAFHPDGRLAASAGDRLSMFHLVTGDEALIHLTDNDGYRPLAFSPDGRHLAAGDTNAGRLLLWDTWDSIDGDAHYLDFDSLASVTDIRFSPDGRLVATCADDLEFRLLVRDGDGWDDRLGPREDVFTFDFSPDSRTLAVGLDLDRVELRDAETFVRRREITFGQHSRESAQFARYGRDGKSLIVLSGSDGSRNAEPWCVRRWDLAARKETHRADLPAPTAIAMTADQRYLATLRSPSSPAVHFWDLETWRDAGSLAWDTADAPSSLAFSPDGETLATGSASGVVKLWPWRLLLEGQS